MCSHGVKEGMYLAQVTDMEILLEKREAKLKSVKAELKASKESLKELSAENSAQKELPAEVLDRSSRHSRKELS